MRIKTLLLGSACAFAICAGAQAADLIEPIDHSGPNIAGQPVTGADLKKDVGLMLAAFKDHGSDFIKKYDINYIPLGAGPKVAPVTLTDKYKISGSPPT